MNNNYNNPFFDYFNNFINPEAATNMLKNIPILDFSCCSNMMKANIQMFANANQAIVENLHNIVQKSTEVAQHNTHEFLNFIKDSVSANNVDQIVAGGQRYFKNSCQKCCDNGKQVMDTVAKSSSEFFNNVSNQASDNINTNVNKNKKSY